MLNWNETDPHECPLLAVFSLYIRIRADLVSPCLSDQAATSTFYLSARSEVSPAHSREKASAWFLISFQLSGMSGGYLLYAFRRMLFRLPQVVLCLHAEPQIRTGTESLGQP